MLLEPINSSDLEGIKWVKLQSWLRLAVDNASISYSMSYPLTDILSSDTEGVKWAKLGAWMQLLAQNISGGGGSGITELTGDVTAGPGSGPQGATIANGAVTTAKIAAAPTLTSPILQLSAALAVDDTYAGTTISGRNAGATIAQWEAVYVGGSSTWLLADANAAGAAPARGLAVAAYVDTNPAIILTQGTVRNDAWAWTPNGAIYLSATPGALTQTAPSTSGDIVQQVGYAITADIAYFDFNSTYLTVE